MSSKNSKVIFRPEKVQSDKEKKEAHSLVIRYKSMPGDKIVATQVITPTDAFDGNWHKLAEALAEGRNHDFRLI